MKPTAKETAQAIAWAALAAHARKRGSRKSLEHGTETVCKFEIIGRVGRRKFAHDLKGVLEVGEPSPTGSTVRPSLLLLLASAMESMPKATLEKWLEELKPGADLEPGKEYQAAAESLVKRLSTHGPKAASVRFILAG